MSLRLSLATAVVFGAFAAADPTWPNPQIDHLEDVMYLQTGLIRFGLVDGVNPCSFSPDGGGRTAAAEWVRTAFHDFATHNATAGTGGLDASIMFELDRPENPGAAFNSTFAFLSDFHTTRSSMADLIALGMFAAVRSCGGPTVTFRAGRIDATAAGPTGVPQPTHDLKTMVNRFATAGFNTSDMIAMVACGHTLGGVHGEDFPQITGNASAASFPKFDTTYAQFDNSIVTEYVHGHSVDPLAVGPSATDSDRRVFGADNNRTMNRLKDANVFSTTCANILARMVEAVPKSVSLTPPIQPYSVKPYQLQLNLNANGTLTFSGWIRVRGTGMNDTDFTVELPYLTRNGKTCASCKIATTRPIFLGGASNGFDDVFYWHQFSAVLPASTSISRFNVTVKSASGSTVHNNNGHGFPVQDQIIFQQAQSCLNVTADAHGNFRLTVVAAVRSGQTSIPSLDVVVEKPRQGVLIPALVPTSVNMARWGPQAGGYTLFIGFFDLPEASWSTKFGVSLGSGAQRFADDFKDTGSISGNECSKFA